MGSLYIRLFIQMYVYIYLSIRICFSETSAILEKNDLCMSQYVQNPTHKDGNILDLVFTNNVNFIHDCVTIPVLQSTSHHHIVMVTTPYKVQIHPIKDEEKTQQNMFNSLNFFSKEVDWE